MNKKLSILTGLLLLGSYGFSSEILFTDVDWIQMEEETQSKATSQIEKAEQELDHMQDKMDYYQRVVRSIEREEKELKELKKMRVRK